MTAGFIPDHTFNFHPEPQLEYYLSYPKRAYRQYV
jgi:hypothetical protein